MNHLVEAFLFRSIGFFLQRLPLKAVRKLAALVGAVVYRSIPIRKGLTLSQLRFAFPDCDEAWIRSTARASYVNLVTTIFELLWTPRLTPEMMDSQFRIHGEDVLRHAMKKGFGVVIVSGHLGNWEWMSICVGHLLKLSLTVPVHPLHNPRVDAIVERYRTMFGSSVVPLSNAVRTVITKLRSRGVVAMLADQSGPTGSIYAEFFGRPAATYEGPAFFALRCASPVIMTYNVRASDGTYDVFFEELSAGDLSGSNAAAVETLTRRHVKALEGIIRRNPGSWLWQHKRWKHSHLVEGA